MIEAFVEAEGSLMKMACRPKTTCKGPFEDRKNVFLGCLARKHGREHLHEVSMAHVQLQEFSRGFRCLIERVCAQLSALMHFKAATAPAGPEARLQFRGIQKDLD